MKNALAPRDPAARRREYRARREARDTARASGILFDKLIDIYLANPEWDGGRIVKEGT